jgi:hypothetical protein
MHPFEHSLGVVQSTTAGGDALKEYRFFYFLISNSYFLNRVRRRLSETAPTILSYPNIAG